MNGKDYIYLQITTYGLHTQMDLEKRFIILCERLEGWK